MQQLSRNINYGSTWKRPRSSPRSQNFCGFISNLPVAYMCIKFKIVRLLFGPLLGLSYVRLKIRLRLGFKLKYYIRPMSSIFRYFKIVKVKHYIMLAKCHAHLHITLKLVKN